MKWFRRRDQITTGNLAAESEAFLNGSYAVQLLQQERFIPPWAWLNRNAHGDLTTIQGVAAQLSHEESTVSINGSWATAERVLAEELCAIVGDDEELLRRVQRQVLIPLEMSLIDRQFTEGLTPPGLVLSVRAALRSSAP